MTIDAHITQYPDEFIPIFEREDSSLRLCCNQQANVNGKNVVFLTSGTPNATASSRGATGLIPATQNANTQTTVTLAELHDLREGTRFSWDLSQANQRLIAAKGASTSLARKMDQQVIDQLDAASVTQTAATASLEWVQSAIATLGEANIPVEDVDNMFAVVSLKARKYLYQIPEFNSSDYVDVKPLDGPIVKMKRWGGVNWKFYNGLTGVGTASESCFFFHRDSIGHAMNGPPVAAAGYDQKQDMYWARASADAQAKLLQNSGIVKAYHNGL